jgi:hypothetical protein
MKVEVKQAELAAAGAELAIVGLFEGDELPAPIAPANGAGEAKAKFKKLSLLRPDGFPPVLVAGLGARNDLDAEKLRVAGALAAKEAERLEAGSIAWALP